MPEVDHTTKRLPNKNKNKKKATTIKTFKYHTSFNVSGTTSVLMCSLDAGAIVYQLVFMSGVPQQTHWHANPHTHTYCWNVQNAYATCNIRPYNSNCYNQPTKPCHMTYRRYKLNVLFKLLGENVSQIFIQWQTIQWQELA